MIQQLNPDFLEKSEWILKRIFIQVVMSINKIVGSGKNENPQLIGGGALFDLEYDPTT